MTLLLLLLICLADAQGARAADDPSLTDALAERSKERLRQLGALAVDSPEGLPFRRVDGSSGFASVILPRRAEPYSLTELTQLFPESFAWLEAGDLLLKDDIVVGEGAILTIDSTMVSTLRMTSTRDRFVTITSWRGTLLLAGNANARLEIMSWDPGRASVDTNLGDGRAWIHSRRGMMDLHHVDVSFLGFASGSLSGVAWEGRLNNPARGTVAYSNFDQNYIGAFAFEATEMVWRFNRFTQSTLSGLGLQDHVTRFVIEHNQFERNGGSGISCSSGCGFNRIQFNTIVGNSQHGIVLREPLQPNAEGRLRPIAGSTTEFNLIRYNLISQNDAGVAIDGGSNTLISDNTLTYNSTGIRLKGAAVANQILTNNLVNNSTIGIYLYGASDSNEVRANQIVGGDRAIEIKDSLEIVVGENVIRSPGSTGIYLIGELAGTQVTDNKVHDGASALSAGKATGKIRFSDNNFAAPGQGSSQWSITASVIRGMTWAVLLLFPLLGWPYVSKAISRLRVSSRHLAGSR